MRTTKMHYKPVIEENASELGFDWQELDRKLGRTKIGAFQGKTGAFYGPLMVQLQFYWSMDIETACTNGVYFIWNPQWFLELPKDTRVTVMMHELRHVAQFHMVRRDGRDPLIWNYACDYSINSDLKTDGYKFDGTSYLYDPIFHGWSAERIYEYLMAHATKIPQGCWGKLEGDVDQIEDDDSENGSTIRRIQGNLLTAIEAAKAARQPGAIPGNLEERLNRFMKPIIKWEPILYRFMDDLILDRYAYNRPNRRFPDACLPSMARSEQLKNLAYIFDVSGSVTPKQEQRFSSEVKFIKEKYKPELLTLVQFDTIIQKIDTWKQDEVFDGITIRGRGGTRISCVREWIIKNQPDAVIIFSDLYLEDTYIPITGGPPIIWVAIGNKQAVVPKGDIIIHIGAND